MSTDLSLSIELIYLMDWIVKNEKTLLNNLVKHSIENGFIKELDKIDLGNHTNPDLLFEVVYAFMTKIEDCLVENLEKAQLSDSQSEEIIPAIKKISMESIDLKTMWLSLQQTKIQLNKVQKQQNRHEKLDVENAQNTKHNSTSILFEQIIKNWKPTKKEIIH